MERSELNRRLIDTFGFTPTDGQAEVLRHLAAFLLSDKPNPTYILRGYAGTGKTTLVTTLVRTLPELSMSVVLMAPTGRAAKVMSSYTRCFASTIHKKIYQVATFPDGSLRVTRAQNKHKNTLFIVDEASMIGEEREFGTKSLLDDLLEYVFSGEQCRLLLIGDTAQLPPVGNDHSPALDIEYLRSQFPLTIATYELTEVKRQALQSGILSNATHLRELLADDRTQYSLPLFDLHFDDTRRIDPETFEEMLHHAFDADKDAVVICKSNKRANLFNQAIRSRVLNIDGEIATGDRLMIVKNNYFWADGNKEISFIANGDMAEIMKISRYEELYGFRFADVQLRFTDYPDAPCFDVKIHLSQDARRAMGRGLCGFLIEFEGSIREGRRAVALHRLDASAGSALFREFQGGVFRVKFLWMPQPIIEHTPLGEMVTFQKHRLPDIEIVPMRQYAAIGIKRIAHMRRPALRFKGIQLFVHAFQSGTAQIGSIRQQKRAQKLNALVHMSYLCLSFVDGQSKTT